MNRFLTLLFLVLLVAGCQTNVPVPAAKPAPARRLAVNVPLPPAPTNHCTNCLPSYQLQFTNWTGYKGTNLAFSLIIRHTNSTVLWVTNTTTNGVYSIWRATNPASAWTQAGNVFVGSNHVTSLTVADTTATRYYRAQKEPGFVIWSYQTVVMSGHDDCAGNYAGWCEYSKPQPAWGWYETGTNHTATELQRTDGNIVYFDGAGNHGCGPGSVTLPSSTYPFQFATYFSSTPPASPHPLWLQGFNP